jgi:hypothetical protein
MKLRAEARGRKGPERREEKEEERTTPILDFFLSSPLRSRVSARGGVEATEEEKGNDSLLKFFFFLHASRLCGEERQKNRV